MTLYQKNIGEKGERTAIDFLLKNKFTILEKNFKSKFGEIDIIAFKNNCLYFFEVKSRTSIKKGLPWEAVTQQKIKHIKSAATYYLLQCPCKNCKLKIGVISILFKNSGLEIKFFDNID